MRTMYTLLGLFTLIGGIQFWMFGETGSIMIQGALFMVISGYCFATVFRSIQKVGNKKEES